jgi:hypothetical protein
MRLCQTDSPFTGAQLGLTAAQRKDFDAFVGAIPCVSLDAVCETEVRKSGSWICTPRADGTLQGEEGGDILEGDIATCNVHLSLERLASSGTDFGLRRNCIASVAHSGLRHAAESIPTPFFPALKEEAWWVLLADVSSNTLYAAQKVRFVGRWRAVQNLTRNAQVNLVTKCGLKRFRAARSTPQNAPGAASSAVASTDAGQPTPAAAPATPVKVRQACKVLLGARTHACCVQSDEPAPGDLVMPLKFRAPPSGVHLLQVRPSHAQLRMVARC